MANRTTTPCVRCAAPWLEAEPPSVNRSTGLRARRTFRLMNGTQTIIGIADMAGFRPSVLAQG